MTIYPFSEGYDCPILPKLAELRKTSKALRMNTGSDLFGMVGL
jgi:hypothetical protein